MVRLVLDYVVAFFRALPSIWYTARMEYEVELEHQRGLCSCYINDDDLDVLIGVPVIGPDQVDYVNDYIVRR